MMKKQRRCSPRRMNLYSRVALCALCSTCMLLRSAAFSPAGAARRRMVSINISHPKTLVPRNLADSSNQNDKSDGEKKAEFERAVRIAKAKKDIDMILSGPDAPFDLEGELKKVQGISPPLAADNAKEQQLDDQVNELESELYAAVESQDYSLASQKKEEIGKLHVDDCGAVLQVNSAFYRAFSEKDYEAMESIWLKDGSALCIHPSHPPLVGANAVLKSWAKMFASNSNFQRNWMEPTNIRLTVKGATAIITCDEQVYGRRFVRGKKRQTELVNKLTATNIFRKVNGKWYMVHHHSSWHADSEAAKMALKGGSTEGGNNKLLDDKKRRNKSDLEISPDGFIGNFGPILGGPSPSQPPPEGSSVKRIVMGGSLSDLLNGGLNDLLSGSISGDDQQDEEGSAIIHFQRVDEDDGDEDGEDNDEEGEDGETEAVSIMKQWAKSKDGKEGSSSSSSSSASGGITSGGSNAPKDALRQNCISALRKLCNQGSISPKQKRVLLTDIITCSAKGEFSMVEVAYELLCGEGDDKDAAEEEFAEQCRVFAHSLPQVPPSPTS